MTELTDELIDKIEVYLAHNNIELGNNELDQIRDVLDSILEKYEE